MIETRIAPRCRVMKPAKIEYGGMKTPCTIHDLSETGAALDISELNGKIPAAFNLVMPEKGLKLACGVARRISYRRRIRLSVGFWLIRQRWMQA
jgi:PilZ domain